MNETITLRPESRASTKDVIIDYMLASVDEVEQLQPALNLLAQPSVARGGHDFFVHCYEAGTQNKAAETEPALPDVVFRDSTPWMQRSGLLCAAAGRLNALGQPLTHNRLCDLAGQYCASVADADAETRSGFIPYAAYRCRFTGGCCGISILLASVCSRRCCTCWPGRAIPPGPGSRLNGCSGRAAFWGIKASLRS